ncbi:hypothetical protein [Rhodopirellula baltica]
MRTSPGADAQLRVPTSIFLPTIRDQPKDAMQGTNVRSGSNVVEQSTNSSQ